MATSEVTVNGRRLTQREVDLIVVSLRSTSRLAAEANMNEPEMEAMMLAEEMDRK